MSASSTRSNRRITRKMTRGRRGRTPVAAGAAIQTSGSSGSRRPSKSKTKRFAANRSGKLSTKRVVRALTDVDADGENTRHGTFEAHAEEQTPERMPPAWGEEGPPTRSVNSSVVLDDARKVADIASAMRVDVQSNGETLCRRAIEHRRRVAGKRVAREFFQSLLETLGRKCRQVLKDGVHRSAASMRRAGRFASRRSRRSLNQGRRASRTGARWP